MIGQPRFDRLLNSGDLAIMDQMHATIANPSLHHALETALAAHQAGELERAEAGYRAVLERNPGNVDALQYLGLIAQQRGDGITARKLMEEALSHPGSAANGTLLNNMASMLVRLGDHELAETHYRMALATETAPADTRRNLGVLLRLRGRLAESRSLLEEVVRATPDHAQAWRDLVDVQLMEGDYPAAAESCRTCFELEPENARVRAYLALILQTLGRNAEAARLGGASALSRLVAGGQLDEAAEAEIARELAADPEGGTVHIGIGLALIRAGRLADGKRFLRCLAVSRPGNALLRSDIGGHLAGLGLKAEALAFLREAVRLAPENAEIHNNLGNVLGDLHAFPEAIAALKKAITLQPDLCEAHVALCRIYRERNELDLAAFHARLAASLPGYTPRHMSTLAQVFRATCDFGNMDALGPLWQACDAVSALQLPSLFLGLLVDVSTGEEGHRLRSIIDRWARHVETEAEASPLAAPAAALSSCGPRNRKPRRRIGFLSADLRSHSVARFLLPLVRGLDRQRFDVCCYTPFRYAGDATQAEFQDHATLFRILENRSPREIAEILHNDELDILIEMNGFTQGSCLSSLAWRPAPVQMTWIGYPFTTSLAAVDHVILDRHALPEDETLLTEEAVVMPDTWLCFDRFSEIPIGPLPFESQKAITFGTLNNTYKITRDVVALWARVMEAVPESRFLIVRPEVAAHATVANLAAAFQSHGIAPDRLLCFDNRKDSRSHLHGYNSIDIALDTFPVTGGTTTCESLWMGVPTITLRGPNFHQRVSHSVLMQAGLEAWSTDSPEQFVAIARDLARDPSRLAVWRSGLRGRLQDSPLCDATRFVHQFQEMLEQVAAVHGLP